MIKFNEMCSMHIVKHRMMRYLVCRDLSCIAVNLMIKEK